MEVQTCKQAVDGVNQWAIKSKLASGPRQTNVNNLRTQLDTVRARRGTLDTNDVRRVTSKQAFDIARRVGDTNAPTATLNNEVAAQSGRITKVTGRNTMLMASRNIDGTRRARQKVVG